ncbi:MAG: 4-hydroxy-2-oxoglutarate aldolase [Acidobacteriota bacterium]|nr:4-hydroxy-2-oxoglutarate aldolase [Acidobacteriota bacterium]
MKQHIETNKKNSFTASALHSLRGVLLPFPTPFNQDGEVGTYALSTNIKDWNKVGVSGYVALGSTGERVHLDEREFLSVIQAARASVPENLAFIVGVGQQSTRASIDEVRRVAEAGADAVLVITPNFYRAEMTQKVLAEHYVAVADASPVPVLLYSVPHLTNVALAPETIARLSEHENIVGVKDSSGDILALAETIRLVPDEFAVLTGNGSALYPALCVGAKGGILAIGCIAPRLAVAIYEAFEAGEQKSAREMQARLTIATRGVLGRYGIGGLKAALDMLGYAGGPVRAPLQDANEEARREIAKVLKEAGLLGDEASVDESRSAGVSIK